MGKIYPMHCWSSSLLPHHWVSQYNSLYKCQQESPELINIYHCHVSHLVMSSQISECNWALCLVYCYAGLTFLRGFLFCHWSSYQLQTADPQQQHQHLSVNAHNRGRESAGPNSVTEIWAGGEMLLAAFLSWGGNEWDRQRAADAGSSVSIGSQSYTSSHISQLIISWYHYDSHHQASPALWLTFRSLGFL